MKKKIFIAGHNGMVGSAIYKKLKKKHHVTTISKIKMNLLNQKKVYNYFANHNFDELYICAAKVGGIYANKTFPANFIYENITIATNLIHAAYKGSVKKVMFLGSSCIYPKNINKNIKETDLLKSNLEKTNEPYSIAKIAGIKMIQYYNQQYNTDMRCVMPNNLYGKNDNYDLKNSHVVAALLRKLHEAKKKNKKCVTLWGSGKPKRELLNVEDMADFTIKIMSMSKKKFSDLTKNDYIVNLSSNYEISIKKLSEKISRTIGYKGLIKFNNNGLDGVIRKQLNKQRQNKCNLKAKINLDLGIEIAYKDFLNRYESQSIK